MMERTRSSALPARLGLVVLTLIAGWTPAAIADRNGQHTAASSPAKEATKSDQTRLVFEAAYQAILIEEPLSAARLLDHVATILPTPSVLNNAGTARAMHAVFLRDKHGPPLIYPWVLDTDLRTEDRETDRRRYPQSGGPKWVDEANDRLMRALLINPSYLPALINHGSVEGLRGRLGSVNDEAGNALLVAEHEGNGRAEALALTVRGVAYASHGRYEAAKEDFFKAEKLGYEVARLNLRVLDGLPVPTAVSTQAAVDTSSEERIGNFTPLEAVKRFSGKLFRSFQVGSNRIDSLPGVALTWNADADARMVTLRISPVEERERSRSYVLLRTKDGYVGQTARGLALGSRDEEVRQAYGAPSRILDQLEGQFVVYRVPCIVFETRQGQVVGWMLYESIP